MFGLVSLLALLYSGQVDHVLYLVTFSIAVGLAACVIGVLAIVRARHENATRPAGSLAGTILGGVSVLLSMMVLLLMIFSTQINRYEKCVRESTGTAASQACAQQLMKSVQQQESR